MFGNAALTFRFVRVAHPGHNAEVGGQLLLVLEVVDVADDAQQDRAAFLADANFLVTYIKGDLFNITLWIR